jgi:hypothetical protein
VIRSTPGQPLCLVLDLVAPDAAAVLTEGWDGLVQQHAVRDFMGDVAGLATKAVRVVVHDDPPPTGEHGGGREGTGLDPVEVPHGLGDRLGQVGEPDHRDLEEGGVLPGIQRVGRAEPEFASELSRGAVGLRLESPPHEL